MPGLVELPRWNTKLNELVFQEFVMRILRVEFQAQNELFALAEVSVHFGACGLGNLIDESIEFVLSGWLKAYRVLLQLEWETGALRHFDRLLELVSDLPQIVGFGTRVGSAEVLHLDEGLLEHWWSLEGLGNVDGIL